MSPHPQLAPYPIYSITIGPTSVKVDKFKRPAAGISAYVMGCFSPQEWEVFGRVFGRTRETTRDTIRVGHSLEDIVVVPSMREYFSLQVLKGGDLD